MNKSDIIMVPANASKINKQKNHPIITLRISTVSPTPRFLQISPLNSPNYPLASSTEV